LNWKSGGSGEPRPSGDDDVEHALEKFEKGNYGLCENFGQPNAFEPWSAPSGGLLRELPKALQSKECQKSHHPYKWRDVNLRRYRIRSSTWPTTTQWRLVTTLPLRTSVDLAFSVLPISMNTGALRVFSRAMP
jgi:hypothetical protein